MWMVRVTMVAATSMEVLVLGVPRVVTVMMVKSAVVVVEMETVPSIGMTVMASTTAVMLAIMRLVMS